MYQTYKLQKNVNKLRYKTTYRIEWECLFNAKVFFLYFVIALSFMHCVQNLGLAGVKNSGSSFFFDLWIFVFTSVYLFTFLQVLKTGDHLLVHNINCLVRLGAGVIFLLWHCFDEVRQPYAKIGFSLNNLCSK